MFAGLVLADRYELIEKLGAGGMGSVWRAHDQKLNADVAIKLLAPQFVESDLALSRFRREAQAAAVIRSTYVVQIFDHGVDKGVPFIAMELLKGESLAQCLQRERALPPASTSRILGQVARALALAHSSGIVHRDMKPDNVFLVSEDEEVLAKVLDFGVARHHSDLGQSVGLRTSTGAILGTPFYMSPEQATGQVVDRLTDIWAYGVIACECLTGKRAFTGDSLGGLFHAICMANMPVPSTLNKVPAGFDEWFARAVARDKDARFQSIKEAAEGLRFVCGGTSVHSVEPAAPVESADTLQTGVPAMSVDVPVSLSGEMAHQSLTGDPSSVSVANLSAQRRKSPNVLVWVVAALAFGVLLVGWRWLTRPAASVSAASASGAPSITSQLAQYVPTAVSVAPSAQLIENPDNLPLELGEPTSKRKNAPKAARSKPEASSTQANPATTPSVISQPRNPARGADDNAAGI
jgi:serine/threonine protein kinase